MLVKICGTTNLGDARLAVGWGADALGFIFAPSRRRVTAEQAAAIARELPEGVGRVGVFTECNVSEIQRTVEVAGLTAVQMHWDYCPEKVLGLRAALGPEVGLWQVVGFEVGTADAQAGEQRFSESAGAALRDARLAVVLLDTAKGGASGGQGIAFPWARARVLLDQLAPTENGAQRPRLVLAGGLHEGNVQEGIRELGPEGVDAVSGTEKSPGHKDPDRLKAFLLKAKAARG